jgi:hypothetical protein
MIIKRYSIQNTIDLVENMGQRRLQSGKYLVAHDQNQKEISRVEISGWDKEKIMEYLRQKNNVANDELISKLLKLVED